MVRIFSAFYFFFLGLSYTLCVSLEILFKLRQPLLNSYSTRAIYYHILSHLNAILFLAAISYSHEIGLTSENQCFIKTSTWGNYLVLTLICVCCPFAILVGLHAVISFRYIYSIKKRIYLLRYTIVMVLYALGWFPVVIAEIRHIVKTDPKIWNVVSWACCVVAGLIANLVRLSDPALIGKTKKRWKREQSVRLSLINTYVPGRSSVIQQELIDFFQGVFIEVGNRQGTMSALISLYQLQIKIRHGKFERTNKAASHRFKGKDLGSESLEMEEIKDQCKRHSVASYKFYVREFFPLLFAGFRTSVGGIDFETSLDPRRNEKVLKRNIGNRGGKSDAFIFLTYDRKLILKSLSKREINFFLKDLLPGYEVRINSGESLLARVLGVYTIKTSKGLKQHIMVMQNIIASTEIIAIFDMKGSKVARKILKHNQEVPIEELPSYQTYKDLDFFLTQKQLHLFPQDSERLIQVSKADVEMLRKHGVMDYSLLIAVGRLGPESNFHMFLEAGLETSRVYYVGIIDYLQLYDSKKQLEGLGKSLLHSTAQREDISSVDPETYARRFLELVEQIAKP